MTIQVIGILGLFVLMVVLMMTRKLPTILALPIMAVGIALIAGIPFMGGEFSIAKDVLEAGAMRMSTAIAGLFFGGFFGKVLSRVGITNTIIRKAAEMAGDKPLPIAYAFLIVTSVIFAASNGLGMFILVGTIIVPIMISAGLSPLVAGTILLLGNGVGVTFSVGDRYTVFLPLRSSADRSSRHHGIRDGEIRRQEEKGMGNAGFRYGR